jgi:DNA-binding response OmpR family regulator
MYINESDKLPVIWVVEDDPYTLMICKRLLEKNGYNSRGFSSAEELLASGWQTDPDIILSDIHLPGKSGTELCSIIRNETKRIHLIALDTSLERIALLDAGFDDVLTKPFTEESLLAIIGSAAEATTLLDFPLLEQLIDDPLERLKILRQFRNDTNEDLATLANAISEKDIRTIMLLVHRLAGRFAQMDQKELAESLHKLEIDMRNRPTLYETKPELERAVIVIREFEEKLDAVLLASI